MKFNQGKGIWIFFGAIFAFIFFFVLAFIFHPDTGLAQLDADAPDIADVQISELDQDSVRVTWNTDRDADSRINFGIDRRYGIVRDPGFDKTEHELIIDDLLPSTKYHFRIVSTDDLGNQGISGNYSFITEGSGRVQNIERVESIDDKSKLEQIASLIEGLTEEEALRRLQNEIREKAEGLSDELTIIGPPNVEPDVSSAIVTWQTNRASDSVVYFSPEDQYNPGAADPYIYSQNGLGGGTTAHEVEIIGLEPFTLYHFKVASEDEFGIGGESADYTFRTKALVPVIQEFFVVKAEEESATLSWSTTIPSSALLEYENLRTGQRFSKGSPTQTTDHTLRIDGLEFGTRYRATAVAESAGGETVRSNPVEFVTVRDEEPPIISNVTNESTLYPGVETKVQTIISWATDEPSLCTLFYRQGIAPTIEPTEVPPRDENYVEKHVQILVSFRPSTVYQFWAECEDRAGNEEKSEFYVLFTPQQEKSIIDIILENFEGAFGWVKDL
ncbi:MAG: fibronectin type III domain-containing protein [Candidatus Spechtbacterales bacterium]|nr:fibronectin type III domain-containing protein [Candidatus Spechtbacterales bacterium]